VDKLAEKYYTREEIKDALIVDFEGLIYGKVEDFFIKENNVFIKAYIEVKAEEIHVDYTKLKQILEEKGEKLDPEAPLEVLVARAKELGLDIPYIKADRNVKLVKGVFPVSEILWINTATLLMGEKEEKLTVVLLKTPREAKYRGLKPQKTAVITEDSIKGKLVLSLTKGILGYAGEIVVGFGKAGLRVYKRRGEKRYVNWLHFITELRRNKLLELADTLSEYINPYKYSRIPLSKLKEVEKILQEDKNGELAMKLLQENIETGEEEALFVDIPLTKILKVREVVIAE